MQHLFCTGGSFKGWGGVLNFFTRECGGCTLHWRGDFVVENVYTIVQGKVVAADVTFRGLNSGLWGSMFRRVSAECASSFAVVNLERLLYLESIVLR